MSNESFDINYPDVPLINQLSNMSCWAASAAMIVGWRDHLTIDRDAINSGTNQWSAYVTGLQPGDVPTLANIWNLTIEPPQSYTIDGLQALLQNHGPLWVGAATPNLHVIVVTGMYSDGSADNTFVRINDPWDRDPGSPGAVGAYLNTHDNGSQYVLTLAQFASEYESAATFPGVNIQVLHGELQN